MEQMTKEAIRMRAIAIRMNPKIEKWMKDEKIASFLNALFQLLADNKK